MTDASRNAYLASTRRALREEFSRSLHHLPTWIMAALDKLYSTVPFRVPLSPLAVTGVYHMRDFPADADILKVQLLLQKGWDLETSVMAYKNFRFLHPRLPYDHSMLLTFNREQLRDELGHTYGEIVADLCSDPTAQPIFAALLFGKLDDKVTRGFLRHVFAIHVSGLARTADFSRGWPDGLHMVLQGCHPSDLSQAETVSEAEALELYEKHTGRRLPGIDLNPRTYDYDKAAIRAALREADCAFDPFCERPHES